MMQTICTCDKCEKEERFPIDSSEYSQEYHQIHIQKNRSEKESAVLCGACYEEFRLIKIDITHKYHDLELKETLKLFNKFTVNKRG